MAPRLNAFKAVPMSISSSGNYTKINASVWDVVSGAYAAGLVEGGFAAALSSPPPPAPTRNAVGLNRPRTCTRPAGWCQAPAEYHTWDCDGDGLLDSVCVGTENNGKHGLLLSKQKCSRNGLHAAWPTALKSACPSFNSTW